MQQLGDFGFSDWLVDSLEVSEEGGMVAWDGDAIYRSTFTT